MSELDKDPPSPPPPAAEVAVISDLVAREGRGCTGRLGHCSLSQFSSVCGSAGRLKGALATTGTEGDGDRRFPVDHLTRTVILSERVGPLVPRDCPLNRGSCPVCGPKRPLAASCKTWDPGATPGEWTLHRPRHGLRSPHSLHAAAERASEMISRTQVRGSQASPPRLWLAHPGAQRHRPTHGGFFHKPRVLTSASDVRTENQLQK